MKLRTFSNFLLIILLMFCTIATAQNLTISSSGETGTSGTNWSISGTTLTVAGLANIQASVIQNALANGPLTIVGNSSSIAIDISQAITSTSGNDLRIGGSGNTVGQVNINSSISNAGSITIDGGGILQNTNAILTTTGSGKTVTLNSTVHIDFSPGNQINTNNGNVTINADSDANNSGNMFVEGLTVNPGSGDVTFRAYWITSEVCTVNGTGKLVAESSGSTFFGAVWPQFFTPAATLTGLRIGKTTNANDVWVYDQALTINGPIELNGLGVYIQRDVNSTAAGAEVKFQALSNIDVNGTLNVTSTNGKVSFIADSDANGSGQFFGAGLTVNPDSGDVLIRAETIQTNETANINGTGNLVVESSDAAFGAAVSNSSFVLANTLKSFTFGSSTNTANITLSSDITVNGSISVMGGIVTVNANLTSSADGDIFIKGIARNNPSVIVNSTKTINKSAGSGTLTLQGHARVNNSGTISATGTGQLNVVMWSDFDNSNNDGGVSLFGTISTNGGHVWLGGSNSNGGSYTWNGLTVGDGPSIGSVDYNYNALDIFGNITTSGGDFLAWAGNGVGAGINGIGTVTGYSVNVGSGDIVLITDAILGTGPSLFFNQSGGSFTLVPNDGDFGTTFNWDGVTNLVAGYGTGWNFGGNFNYLWLENPASLTSLTIGKYDGMLSGSTPVVLSNSSNVTFSNTTATSIAGPISIYGGDITISQNLTSSLADADILLQATGAIILSASRTLQTSGGDVTLNATSGGTATTAQSAIYLNGSSQILSNGGNITLGGGYSGTEGNLYAASTISGIGYAVRMDAATVLNAAGAAVGGNINVYGRKLLSYGDGVYLNSVNISTIGSGTIGINGDSFGGFNGTTYFGGITFENQASTIQTVNGNLTLNGILTDSQSSQGYGINFYRSSGSAGQTRHIQLLSRTGAIEVTGDGGSTIGGGIGHSSWGDVYFGSPADASYTATGDVTISYSKLVGASANGFKVKTTGDVSYLPTGTSFAAAQTMPHNSNYVVADGASSLTIGKASNTANITMDAATTVAGPISVYGGTIAINDNLNTSSGTTSGNILLKGSGDVILASSKSITTSGGDVILWSNSDGQTTTGGAFLKRGSGITTGGGHIWMAGGGSNTTWNGLTVGDGYAVSGSSVGSGITDMAYTGSNDYNAGINLYQVTLSSGGGDIYMAGQRNLTSAFGAGIVNFSGTGTLIDAGSGAVTIKGDNSGAGTLVPGIMTGLRAADYTGSFVVQSVNTSATNAITIEGTTSAGSETAGILIEGTSRLLSKALTGGAGISVIGTSVANGNAIAIGRSSYNSSAVFDVLSASGAIDVNVGVYSIVLPLSNYKFNLGSITSDTDVASSAANVLITSNVVNWTGNVPVITTGTLTVTPTANNSFASAFNTSSLNYTGISGLTIGNPSNTANITFGATTTIAGAITAYGGTIAVNAALTATNSNINLTASTAATQTAAITANGLALNGAGTFTLENTANNIATIAGGSSAAKIGSLSFVDASGGLEIGTVNPTGITSTGPIKIETLEGNITLSENLATDDTTADAIILNAGKTAAIGTATGGDIIVSGTPTLTYGTGGQAKLFSGRNSNSTGLTALVGGVGNKRVSVDETTVTFSPILANNTSYALYRAEDIQASIISNFNDVNKMYHDVTFTIVTPTSNSTGAFTYTSSNPAVATISGNTVTILSAGTSTITANQAADGNFSSGSVTALLTVGSEEVLLINGGTSHTNPNYIDSNGKKGGSTGVTRYGEIKSTKSN